MDLNYLFHRQQVERAKSETVQSEEARTIHEELAKRYEEQIETLTSDDYRFPHSVRIGSKPDTGLARIGTPAPLGGTAGHHAR